MITGKVRLGRLQNDATDGNASFLEAFTTYTVFYRLARLTEPGKAGIERFGPNRAATKNW